MTASSQRSAVRGQGSSVEGSGGEGGERVRCRELERGRSGTAERARSAGGLAGAFGWVDSGRAGRVPGLTGNERYSVLRECL